MYRCAGNFLVVAKHNLGRRCFVSRSDKRREGISRLKAAACESSRDSAEVAKEAEMKQIQVGSHLWIIKPPLRFLMDLYQAVKDLGPLTAWAVQAAIFTLDRLWLHGRLQAVEQTAVPMWLRPCHSRSSRVTFLPQTDPEQRSRSS